MRIGRHHIYFHLTWSMHFVLNPIQWVAASSWSCSEPACPAHTPSERRSGSPRWRGSTSSSTAVSSSSRRWSRGRGKATPSRSSPMRHRFIWWYAVFCWPLEQRLQDLVAYIYASPRPFEVCWSCWTSHIPKNISKPYKNIKIISLALSTLWECCV